MTDTPTPPDPVGFAVAYLRGGGFRDDGFPIAGLLAMKAVAEAAAELDFEMTDCWADQGVGAIQAAADLSTALSRLDAALAAREGRGS